MRLKKEGANGEELVITFFEVLSVRIFDHNVFKSLGSLNDVSLAHCAHQNHVRKCIRLTNNYSWLSKLKPIRSVLYICCRRFSRKHNQT